MHPVWVRLREALEDPRHDTQRLLARADAVCELFERGDCALGLLPIDILEDLFTAYVRAGDPAALRRFAFALIGQDFARNMIFTRLVDALAANPAREARLLAVRLWMDLGYEDDQPRTLALARELCRDDPDGAAHVLLGYMTHRGYGVPKDDAENARLQTIAAERGNADAMFELSVLAYNGALGARDPDAAIRWCRAAGERGHARAAYNLGAFYAVGNGVPRDPAQALAWYVKASAAGHGQASATAGIMIWKGEGTAPDPVRGKQLLSLAESQGVDPTPLLEEAGLE
jgi:hypothetical protein